MSDTGYDPVVEAQQHIEFWTEYQALAAERAAALETRREDPERWSAAKHAFGAFRSGMRAFREAAGGSGVTANVSAQPAEAGAVAQETTVTVEEG